MVEKTQACRHSYLDYRFRELTIYKIFQSNDIILLTEVWTNDLCDVSVDGFSVFQNAKRDSGGIALYIKYSLMRHSELLKKENDDVIWLKIDKSLLHLSFDLDFMSLLGNSDWVKQRNIN